MKQAGGPEFKTLIIINRALSEGLILVALMTLGNHVLFGAILDMENQANK